MAVFFSMGVTHTADRVFQAMMHKGDIAFDTLRARVTETKQPVGLSDNVFNMVAQTKVDDNSTPR